MRVTYFPSLALQGITYCIFQTPDVEYRVAVSVPLMQIYLLLLIFISVFNYYHITRKNT